MKMLTFSAVLFFALLASLVYVLTRPDYFGTEFENDTFWLSLDNKNIKKINSYQKISEINSLIEFPTDGVTFAELGYVYDKEDFLDYRFIKIPDSLVGKSIYSTKEVDGKLITKLLSRAEAITAFNEWRTKVQLEVVREDLFSDYYKVIRVYINEPIE